MSLSRIDLSTCRVEERNYSLTYDDSDLPRHCGWKVEPRLSTIRNALEGIPKKSVPTDEEVHGVVEDLDENGRWMSISRDGERLVDQPKFKRGEAYLLSERSVCEECADWCGSGRLALWHSIPVMQTVPRRSRSENFVYLVLPDDYYPRQTTTYFHENLPLALYATCSIASVVLPVSAHLVLSCVCGYCDCRPDTDAFQFWCR